LFVLEFLGKGTRTVIKPHSMAEANKAEKLENFQIYVNKTFFMEFIAPSSFQITTKERLHNKNKGSKGGN
jgi:hypothetical protein